MPLFLPIVEALTNVEVAVQTDELPSTRPKFLQAVGSSICLDLEALVALPVKINAGTAEVLR
jgi:hypothetical protein